MGTRYFAVIIPYSLRINWVEVYLAGHEQLGLPGEQGIEAKRLLNEAHVSIM